MGIVSWPNKVGPPQVNYHGTTLTTPVDSERYEWCVSSAVEFAVEDARDVIDVRRAHVRISAERLRFHCRECLHRER